MPELSEKDKQRLALESLRSAISDTKTTGREHEPDIRSLIEFAVSIESDDTGAAYTAKKTVGNEQVVVPVEGTEVTRLTGYLEMLAQEHRQP